MQIQINITIKDNTSFNNVQAMFIKSELDAIVRRFEDPNFLETMKARSGLNKLTGAVIYPDYNMSIQHEVDESINLLEE